MPTALMDLQFSLINRGALFGHRIRIPYDNIGRKFTSGDPLTSELVNVKPFSGRPSVDRLIRRPDSNRLGL